MENKREVLLTIIDNFIINIEWGRSDIQDYHKKVTLEENIANDILKYAQFKIYESNYQINKTNLIKYNRYFELLNDDLYYDDSVIQTYKSNVAVSLNNIENQEKMMQMLNPDFKLTNEQKESMIYKDEKIEKYLKHQQEIKDIRSEIDYYYILENKNKI